MTLEEIKGGIRSLKLSERVELHKWLEYEMAPDFSSSDFCSRIGTDRALEIRHSIEEKSKISQSPRSPKNGRESRPSVRVRPKWGITDRAM